MSGGFNLLDEARNAILPVVLHAGKEYVTFSKFTMVLAIRLVANLPVLLKSLKYRHVFLTVIFSDILFLRPS